LQNAPAENPLKNLHGGLRCAKRALHLKFAARLSPLQKYQVIYIAYIFGNDMNKLMEVRVE